MPFNRGLLGKYASTDSIDGIVTAKEQFVLASAGYYPLVKAPSESPSSVTTGRELTLLLKTDGSDGGDNTTFTDSSTNNHSLTRNGDVIANSFSPHDPDGYSMYFDGNDYIRTPTNGHGITTGNWTLEGWFYMPTINTSNTYALFAFNENNTNALEVLMPNGDGLSVRSDNMGGNFDSRSSIYPEANTWFHLAVTYDGTNVKLYLNGRQLLSAGASGQDMTGTKIDVGAGLRATDFFYTGYVFDFRVVSDVVYTSDFGVDRTSRLTAIENTQFLVCHLPYIADGSTNNLSVIIQGNPTTSPFSPSHTTYIPSTDGGSLYFDGSGDYLSIADAASLDLGNGSTDFTIEFWAYADSAYDTSTSDYVFYSKYQNPGNGIIIRVWNGELVANLSGDAFDINTGFYPQPGVWHHYALVCNGGTVTLYADGVSRGTYSSAIAADSSTATTIGCLFYSGVLQPFKGYISDFRIVKGTAVYTSAFTPPTEPLTAVANTSLLLKGQDAAIYDATSFNTVFLAGNATTSTTQTKYATSSIKLDGSGDYLYLNEDNFAFGTDDFTIELWAYIESFTAPSSSSPIILDFRTSNGVYPLLYIPVGTSNLVWYVNSVARITGTSCLSLNTWHHISVSRSSGLTKLFVDGVQVGSTYTDTNNYGVGTNRPYIGKNGASVNGDLQGYLEDIRITKGYSRYPWIPERETLTGGNVLLAHAATFTDGGSGGATVTSNNGASISTFGPASGMKSIFFDGTDDSVSLSSDGINQDLTSGDFTVETWVYTTTLSRRTIAATRPSLGNFGWVLTLDASGQPWFYFTGGSSVTSSTPLTTNKWHHIAVTRSVNTLTIFLDGTAIASGTVSNGGQTSQAMYLGNDTYDTPYDFSGYISNFKITKGSVLYTDSFTPPTAALT